MSRHNRNSAYKIFHLVSDTSTKDSFEKVFLVEEELEKIKRNLAGKLSIIGLVGPTHRIMSYLAKDSGSQGEKNMMRTEEQKSQEIDLSLGENEIAALFVVGDSRNALGLENVEQGYQTIFLCFVASDQFFYQKPISENSIKYMLIRFMGDLCSNIQILYDDKMEAEFDSTGCPYSTSKKKIAIMKIVKRTERDIVAKDVPCDFSALYNFDPDYGNKLNLKYSVHTKNVLYVGRSLEKDFKKALQDKLRRDQLKIWQMIFKKFTSDSQKILLHIGQPTTKQNIAIIKDLIKIYKKLYEQMIQFGMTALETSIRMYKKSNYSKWWYSDTFKHNIYYYIVGQFELQPEMNKFSFKNKDSYKTVCESALTDIIAEVKYEENLDKSFAFYYVYMAPVIWQAWLQIKPKIEELVQQFFIVSRQLISNKKMSEEDAIDIALFELKAANAEKVTISDHTKILLSARVLREKTQSMISLNMIENIEVYDIRNSQNSKLICLSLRKTHDNPNSLVLLSYSNNNFNLIGTYRKEHLMFKFHAESQKAYILNMNLADEQIISFKIDSLERIVEEKPKKINLKKRQVIDFGVTVFPTETIYYLDKDRNALFSIDILTGEEIIYDCSKSDHRYLTMPGEQKYEYLRTFNEDMYIALGNKKIISIFKPNAGDGKLIIKKTINLDATFLGVTILSQNLNQFLVIFDTNKSKAIVYENMNCDTMLKREYEKKNIFKGNPALDIFHGAKQKFGEYRNYTTNNDNPADKSLNLYHCYKNQQMKQKVQTYWKQLRIEGHNSYFTNFAGSENAKKREVVDAPNFLSQVQTRIPVQLCTLENSNIVPLIKGKLENYHFFKQMTIAERSKIIQFGIVEELLKRKPDKRVIVVSVMGAQSTGKSYLMNRLFGTRFTVSSARCTIGIWLSLVETTEFNYLLMDCEGLFAVHRDFKEEEKLIRVLTSISDYTLLNQNMSMSNRSFVELLEGIAESVRSSATNNTQLYKGEMFIIVRDVKGSDAEGIETEFYKSFETYRRNRSKYIEQLFGGQIHLFCVQHFEKAEFHNDVRLIRDHIQTQGLKRPFRSCIQVLESLKVIVNQLTCDDSKNFEEEMIAFRIGKSKDQILKVWRNGPSLTFKATIRKVELAVDQKLIEISQQEFKKESAGCIQGLDRVFQEKVLHNGHLKTTEYAEVYKEYNDFIIKFFDQRFAEVEKKVAEEIQINIKTCPEEKVNLQLSSLKNLILSHKQKLRLCMQRCSEQKEGCSLPCTSKFRHKFDIESEKETVRVEKDGAEKMMKSKQLSEEERAKESKGIEIIQDQVRKNLIQQESIMTIINKYMVTERQRNGLGTLNSEFQSKITQTLKNISENHKQSVKFLEITKTISGILDNKNFPSLRSEQKKQKIQQIIRSLTDLIQNKIEEISEQNCKQFSQKFIQIEKELAERKQVVDKQIQTKTKFLKQLNGDISQSTVKKEKFSKDQELKIKKLDQIENSIAEINETKNKSFDKFHELQSKSKIENEALKEIANNKKSFEDQMSEKNMRKDEQNTKLGMKEQALRRVEEILQSPIYQHNSYLEYVLPEVIRLNERNISIKKKSYNSLSNTNSNLKSIESIKSNEEQSQKSPEVELAQIKNKLLTDKVITENETEKTMEQQIEANIKRRQNKLKHLKDDKLQKEEKHIVELQAMFDRIGLLNKQLNSRKELEKDKSEFNENLQKFRNVLKDNNYVNFWDIIQEIILLAYEENEKKEEKKDQLSLFQQLLKGKLRELYSELKEEQINIVLTEPFEDINEDIGNKQRTKQELLERYDSFIEEQLPEVDEKMEILQKQAQILQSIAKEEQNALKIFKELIKNQIEKVLQFIKKGSTNQIFKEILQSNPKLSIEIDVENKKVEVDGHPSESFSSLSEKFFVVIEQLRQLQSLIQVGEEEYSAFENSGFSQEAFDKIKGIVAFIAKKLEKDKQKNFKIRVSKQLVSKFEKLVHIEEKNWPSILATITEVFLELNFKQKNEEDKSQLETIKSAQENEMSKIKSEIKSLKQEIQRLTKQIQNCEENRLKKKGTISNLKNLMDAEKKKHEQTENSLKNAKKQFKNLEIEINQIKEKIEQNEETLKSLDIKKNHFEQALELLKQQKSVIQIIDKKKSKQTYEAWKIESSTNFTKFTEIKNLKAKISSNKNKMDELEKQLVLLKKKVGDRKMEEVSKKIEQLQEELEKLSALKAKIKQLFKLQQKFDLLEKRMSQIQKSEKSLCKCLTNHKCQQFCQAGCANEACSGGAGHRGQHLCKLPNHKCNQKCAFDQNCKNQCSQPYDHSADVPHSCHTSHICQKKCKYCEKSCSVSLFEMHEEHICKTDDGCQYKCLLCQSKCASKDHKHDNQAKEVKVWIENKEKNERKLETRRLHLCSKEHECKKKCSETGICAYQYKTTNKKWSKNGCERDYKYIQQVEVRNQCKKKIAVGKLEHGEGECSCMEKEHKCHNRCPDCGSFCQQQIGHSGKHKTEHRNQEQLLYAAQEQNKEIKVGKTGQDYVFTVGDVSLPTRCHSSCESKGRSHYHLIQCKGGHQCLEKKLKKGAKHSAVTYYPYTDKCYDMVLCKIYWELYNFEPPIEKPEFDQCNFTCPYDHEGNKTPFFCTSPAWHSFSSKFTDHTFECAKTHKPTDFTGLEICFLVDATGSMSRFVDECKNTVKEIISKASASKKKVSIKFSIVAYRDHEMSKSNITINLKRLCDEKKKKLQQLPVKNFHNEMFTQQSFIMTLKKLQQKYEQKKSQENLRECFTEKELFILDYHFPFYFDLVSTDDMINANRLISMLNPLGLLLKLLGGGVDGPQTTLRAMLEKDLDDSLEELLKSEKEQKDHPDKHRLLETSNFSNADETIKFLDNLEANGGGDPPEAVLDGMDGVCKLAWSKQPTILRYVFHIFDAPPHGRMYSTDNADRYPDGCPCGKTHQPIIQQLRKLNLNYTIYPLTPRVNATLDIFAASGLKFQRKDIDKDKPEDLGLHVTELICGSIDQEEKMIMRVRD